MYDTREESALIVIFKGKFVKIKVGLNVGVDWGCRAVTIGLLFMLG